jgi:hypothetical protein
MSALSTLLRRQGATLVERHGRCVALHFGSPVGEEAVCRSTVGLADRSDRTTLDVRGPAADVDAALAELGRLGDRAWWLRLGPGRAIVRCEGEDAAACTSAVRQPDGTEVEDLGEAYTGLDLIGPLASDALGELGLDRDDSPVIVVRQDPAFVELLVPRAHGPATWNRLLEAGRPYGLACVGLEALERLSVSEHVGGLRRVAVNP